MKRLIYINIVVSIIVGTYFYFFLSPDERAKILAKTPLSTAVDYKAQKQIFDVQETKKEKSLSEAFKKFNTSLSRSKLKFVSFNLERGSQVKAGKTYAVNTFELQLGKQPKFLSEVENETKEMMKQWLKIYKHDPNEVTVFETEFKGKTLYKLNSTQKL
jgi:hypothetical protein